MVAHRFERTVCACKRCVDCCTRPGPLAPGDFERIAAHVGLSEDDAKLLFWASPGALVLQGGLPRRVGTIVPQTVGGRCVFQQPGGQCGIHAVAPFGCAYFDMHQEPAVFMPRSAWLAVAQRDDEAYQRLRSTLAPRPAMLKSCTDTDMTL